MECPDKSTTRGTPAGPLAFSGCYVLRAACCVLNTKRGMPHKCHLPKRDNKSVCLSVCLSICLSVQLWNASNSSGLVSKFNYVKYFTRQCSCPATSVRLSFRPSGETTVPLSCCSVCHRASRSCGCQTKLAKKLLPLPLPLPQPQPLPSATS